LIGLTHKHKSFEKAREILTKIAANNVEFHKGHSQLAEFIVAGQAAACFTVTHITTPPGKERGRRSITCSQKAPPASSRSR
jgi:ABC-type Fe3+ transport system substrate-binding protein